MNIIGLDIGTTTISAVVLDGESGVIRASRTIPNGTDLPEDVPGGKLQDPEIIVGKVKSVLDELRAEYAPIDAIGMDGQMHGVVYVNAEGRAVSPLYTWQDNRGSLPLGEGTYSSELSRAAGCEMSTGFGLTTHYWMTLNGRIPKDAAKLSSIFDYAAMRLTDRREPLMHTSGAASFGLFDLIGLDWRRDVIAACGMDVSLLPEVVPGCVTVGRTPEGIPVSCGIGDNQASVIGSLRHMDASVLVNMGTGGQISMAGFSAAPLEDLEMRPLVEDKYILAGALLCGGRAYALLEGFIRDVAALAGYDGGKLYEAMNRAVEAGEDLEHPWKVDTRFSGTRRQPEIRGSIQGIGIDNFDARHLVAGVIEGIVDETADLYQKILKAGVQPPAELVGSGNGLRRNKALRRVMERRFGLTMKIPAHNEEAAYGAALYAMAAAGLVGSLADAQGLIRYE